MRQNSEGGYRFLLGPVFYGEKSEGEINARRVSG